jgi:hypothetical protein
VRLGWRREETRPVGYAARPRRLAPTLPPSALPVDLVRSWRTSEGQGSMPDWPVPRTSISRKGAGSHGLAPAATNSRTWLAPAATNTSEPRVAIIRCGFPTLSAAKEPHRERLEMMVIGHRGGRGRSSAACRAPQPWAEPTLRCSPGTTLGRWSVGQLHRRFLVVCGRDPRSKQRSATLLFNTRTHLLSFDRDGTGPLADKVIAVLPGLRTISRSYLILSNRARPRAEAQAGQRAAPSRQRGRHVDFCSARSTYW